MKKALSELTIEELKSKQKAVKLSISLLVGMMIVLVASLIALIALKGARAVVIALSVMPITFLPILIATKKSLKDIATEIELRQQARV